MRIQHNIMAMNAYRNLNNNNNALSGNLEKLSSGYRINRAGDDAAGLAISEKMRAQITGLDVAQDNAQSGINLVQTAEGALTEVHDMLNRMYELAEQSANGTYDDNDRTQLQKEVANLKTEINRIADSANFNGINLLDGNLSAEQLSKADIDFSTITTEEGVTFNSSLAGQGTKGTFTIDLNTLHGTGDTITFKGTTDGANTFGDITLTYGDATGPNTFTGSTLEEQAKSIAEALSMNSNISVNFDITTDGSSVVLTAKKEGIGGGTISAVDTKDATVELGAFNPAKTPGTNATDAFKGGFDALFSSTGAGTSGGIIPEEGDELVFTFTGANGEKLTTTVTVTKAMLGDNKVETFTTNLAKALSEAHFDDIAESGADESKLTVGDLFTVTANKKGSNSANDNPGGLQFTAKAGGASTAVQDVVLKRNGATVQTVNANTAEQASAAAGAAANKYELAKATTANNFTAGDVFILEGKLSDGQSFKVELTAGEDFKIGTDYNTSMNAIVQALTSADTKVSVGNDGKLVTADKIFGATASTTNEFAVTATGGALTIENSKKGVAGTLGIAGQISGISVKTADKASSVFDPEVATAQQSASASLTIDDKILNQYGTAITIGDKTYEIVKDARDVSSRNNVAVVVDDMSTETASSIAQKLADAVKAEDKDGKYEVDLKGSTIEIKTTEKGSHVGAITLDTPYGDKVASATFQFDPKAVKEGSILEFNGNTYEFVKKGGEPTTKGAIAIEVEDFSKATSKSLADAFANVAKNGLVSVAEDGTMTLRSLENADGTVDAPSISFKNGLTLQIGDTSESYNQLTVSIDDCHTQSLGIEDLDIGTQKGAAAALNTIEDAINYVSDVRGTLGATQNRLDHTINNLSVMEENIQDAEANIRDTDVAEEMMEYTKNNILIQSAQAMLAQANQVPQGVLQLLG